jgi:DDB1- and CUL4-associated factor 11
MQGANEALAQEEDPTSPMSESESPPLLDNNLIVINAAEEGFESALSSEELGISEDTGDTDSEDPSYDEDDDDPDFPLEEGEEDEEDDDDDEIMEAHFFSQLSNSVYSRMINQMPLIRDYTPPLVDDKDLVDELTARTAAVNLRAPMTPSKIAAGIGGRNSSFSTPMSPTQSLFFRETQPGGANTAAHRHFSTFHRLPSRPIKIVDRMQSRAYIGRFTPSGDIFIAAYQNERRIRLYDVHNDWKVVKNVYARNLRWTVTDTALSSDENFLLYASITPIVHLVNVTRGDGGTGATESIANITDIHESLNFADNENGGGSSNGIWSLKWSPDNKEIIAGTGDASLYIYDVAAGRTVVRVRGHNDDVNAVAYADSEDGNIILTGSDDHEVKVWDRRLLGSSRGGGSTQSVGVFIGHTEGIAHLDSKLDNRYFISNSKDQSIKLWDLRKARTAKEASTVRRETYRNVPSFSWDYRWMGYPAAGRVVTHPADGAVATYRGGHSVLGTLCRAYFSPAATTGQRYLYAASACGGVTIYDVITCQVVSKLKYHRECVRDCSWHPYLPILASASFDGSVCLWQSQAPGEEEADAEEEEARKRSIIVEEERKARFGKTANPTSPLGATTRSRTACALPQPGRDQLSDFW